MKILTLTQQVKALEQKHQIYSEAAAWHQNRAMEAKQTLDKVLGILDGSIKPSKHVVTKERSPAPDTIAHKVHQVFQTPASLSEATARLKKLYPKSSPKSLYANIRNAVYTTYPMNFKKVEYGVYCLAK